MSLTKLTTNLNNISSLPDKPTLQSDELKQEFDKAGNSIKEYINEILTEEIDKIIANQNKEFNDKITANAKTITTAQLDKIYPIGSIYMSVNTTEPSTIMGGTWERIKDRFLLSAGDTYKNGNTGGNANHSHTNPTTGSYNGTTGAYGGTTGSHVLTINEMPSHNHQMFSNMIAIRSTGGEYSTPTYTSAQVAGSNTKETGGGKGHTHDIPSHTHSIPSHTHTVGNTGSSSNMPPYLTVNMWKRVG